MSNNMASTHIARGPETIKQQPWWTGLERRSPVAGQLPQFEDGRFVPLYIYTLAERQQLLNPIWGELTIRGRNTAFPGCTTIVTPTGYDKSPVPRGVLLAFMATHRAWVRNPRNKVLKLENVAAQALEALLGWMLDACSRHRQYMAGFCPTAYTASQLHSIFCTALVTGVQINLMGFHETCCELEGCDYIRLWHRSVDSCPDVTKILSRHFQPFVSLQCKEKTQEMWQVAHTLKVGASYHCLRKALQEYIYQLVKPLEMGLGNVLTQSQWFFQHGRDDQGNLENYATAFLEKMARRIYYKCEERAVLLFTVLSATVKTGFQNYWTRWRLQGEERDLDVNNLHAFPALPAVSALA